MMQEILLVTVLLTAPPAGAADVSPYVGEEQRLIKSMSEQEIAALLRGDGMGFAKAAELNQYPGPKHVLELADHLDLTAEQRKNTAALYDEMHAQAVAVGERLVAAEAKLDRLFAAGAIDSGSLQRQLELTGELRAKLRFVHLEAHLQQKQILSQRQVAQYVRLRGYGGSHDGHH